MGFREAPSFGELRKFILGITTRRVSEVRLVPRSRVGLRFAETNQNHATSSQARCALLLVGLKLQQSLRFLQQKLVIHEWLVADVLPADSAILIDQERAVKWLRFEIVVRPKRLKDIQRGI